MYRVMIVDDEPNIRNGLRYIIDWEKYNFTICNLARNGKDALEKIKETYPDLIVTDIKMPGLDGLGLIKYIRENLNDKNMSFIILSGYDDFDYAKQAIKYNVRSYLLKPLDEEELISFLKLLNEELSRNNDFEYFYNKKASKFNETFNDIEEFNLLINAIQKNNKPLLEEEVRAIIENFIEKSLHPRLIKIHLDNFLIKISTIINEMGGSVNNIVKNYSLFETDIANMNIIQLEYSLIKFCEDCGLYISELRESCSIIIKVKQYIKNNFSDNLKLKDLAKLYHINSAYLGQLFKKEIGMNFSQYLNEIRIEKAKELLTRTDMHIYEIAEQVGYKNSDYFIIKFKESKDCTPLEYRTGN
ncbi:MAG: response regulator transcription factor [bacterium]